MSSGSISAARRLAAYIRLPVMVILGAISDGLAVKEPGF